MKHFHHLFPKEALKELKTDIQGLSPDEVTHRRVESGYNVLPEAQKTSTIQLFLRQFKNPLIYILFFALIISFSTKHYTDGWIVFTVILVSSLIGFFQEYKANAALSQLKKLVQNRTKVVRNGQEMVIPQKDIVPGDIILLFPGDKIPADARLLDVHNLEVIEASLTGESLPIEKHIRPLEKNTSMADRKNMVYFGTVVARGQSKAIVTATGIHTQIGNIAHLVHTTEESVTPLQKQIMRFGKTIGVVLIVLNFILFGIGILLGQPFFEMFLTSVAMIVAAVPEGLLPAMSIILAIGMQRLSKQKGLVRKMLATETLGAVSVICSDKTGTLTQGNMSVIKIITPHKTITHTNESFSEIMHLHRDASHLTALKIGMLCNDALIENPQDKIHDWKIIGNATEKALLLAGRSAGLDRETLKQEQPRVSEIPFGSEHKFMVTSHKLSSEKYIHYMKGAPEKIFPFLSHLDKDGETNVLEDHKKNELLQQYEVFTRSGLRVLAVAYKIDNQSSLETDDPQNFVFVGFIAFKDPIRPETPKTIEQCRMAGIKTIMITGDHKLTALSIARDLGMPVTETNILQGSDLDKMSEKELQERVRDVLIFARVEPRHKIHIVKALQANGEIVAMTGDGVNDAPALKKADIGVAVGSGTDVAQEIADLVLLDDNFKTIVDAVRQGRGTFDNIRKVALYLLSSSFTEAILIGLSLVFGLPLALLPVQILWMKMVEEPLPSVSLSFDSVNKNVLHRPPRNIHESILHTPLKKLLIFFVLISDTLLFLLFYWAYKSSGDIAYAQTIAFVGLGIASRFYIFSIRDLSRPITKYNPFQNNFTNLAVLIGFLLTLMAVYMPSLNKILHTVPLGLTEWSLLIGYGFVSFFVYEIGKKIFKNPA